MSEINKINYNGTSYDIGGSGSGLTNEAKQALLACFEKVAWIDEDGQDYYDALEAALYPPVGLVSISCVYTQSGTVYTTDSLDSLKSDLVVTAHYDDSSTATITTYTLSGTLTVGTSTITVSYGGKTTTFNVTVTQYDASIYNWNFKTGTTDSKQSAVATLGSGVTQSSSGLTFDGTANGWVYLCDLSSYASSAFTVEVDVDSITNTGEFCLLDLNNASGLTNNPCGLIFTTAWAFRKTDNNNAVIDASLTDRTIFNGHTMKFHCDYANKKWEVFNDGESLGYITSYQNSNGRNYLGISASYTNRYLANGSVITAVRVYEGVV